MEPVDLLLITWNRRGYVEKTLENLLASNDDFRLYCWDNNSQDGVADIISSLNDPRIVEKKFSTENVKQRIPTLWFFEQAKSDLVGKIDDDILLPEGWISTIAPIVRDNSNVGMLGCWIYMEEDWNESIAEHKVLNLEGERIFQNMWIAGQSFLARKETLLRYILPESDGCYGFPIDQYNMTQDGLINGYPLPIIFAHNMDDPRSKYYINKNNGELGEHAALTARARGFVNVNAYAEWIAEDARNILIVSVKEQLKRAYIDGDQSLIGKIRRKLAKFL
ncbi:MAG: hypothetical protein COA90_08545 [Gammaproteobacteria bacterium]|nr:MAG: hypothetical protein COA90_08545 [Gammaproteobacteria bacterium]